MVSCFKLTWNLWCLGLFNLGKVLFPVSKNEPEANFRPEPAAERCFIQEITVKSICFYGKDFVMCEGHFEPVIHTW